MTTTVELARRVVEHWIEGYDSRDDAIEELGDLGSLVGKVAMLIVELELDESDGMTYLSCTIEDRLF